MSKPICQNYGHTNDFCVDNTFDAAGNVIEIALKCEMVLSEVIMEIFVFVFFYWFMYSYLYLCLYDIQVSSDVINSEHK